MNWGYNMIRVRNFASDNNSGACPEVLEILERCNRDDAKGYGEDLWTKRVSCVYTFIGKGGADLCARGVLRMKILLRYYRFNF